MATAFFSQTLASVMVVLLTATHPEARKGADLRAAVQAAAPGEAAAYGLGAALDILFKKQGAK